MAETNNPKDQAPRTNQMTGKIPLVETAERLRRAECVTKGGQYKGRECFKR